jgi:hypothetical protein
MLKRFIAIHIIRHHIFTRKMRMKELKCSNYVSRTVNETARGTASHGVVTVFLLSTLLAITLNQSKFSPHLTTICTASRTLLREVPVLTL